MMLVQRARNEPREVGATVAEMDARLDDLDAEVREQVLPHAVSLWTGPNADGDDGYALTFVVGTTTSSVQWSARPAVQPCELERRTRRRAVLPGQLWRRAQRV